ncbi:Rv3654c family TadE-like protein [Thermomonospora cellulosilytica]|uniref:Rv3654c family TadE-like protein n=1 Tax=Thermomonospora cellulosilytica TaxID=1411118 RepID=UPI0015F99D2F|nr:Rv3654c family TadE-like protein [Thermomonospora cellulosilytica]
MVIRDVPGCLRAVQARRVMGDRGSGTLWVLALMGLIWVMGVAFMAAGGVRAARHRAYGAADLAALAAASRAVEGPEPACRRAAEVAEGWGARLSSCAVRGMVADVEATVTVRLPDPFGSLRFVSRARAGPQGQEGVS